MADFVTRIRTENGDKQIDYNALANLPKFPTSLPANGGNADTVDGKHASDFVLAADVKDTSLASLGITVSAQELNYVDGVTSNIQAQLNNKANAFSSGDTVLSSYQYGEELPSAGTKGRIFFKKVSS